MKARDRVSGDEAKDADGEGGKLNVSLPCEELLARCNLPSERRLALLAMLEAQCIG